jgi:Xaa-Pro aminopeptidase
MTLPIPAVQKALKQDGLDGWLLYDFHGSNPIARRLTDLVSSPKLSTRRWYYLVPAEGAPRGLVHAIERHNLDTLPGDKQPYAGREQLAAGLKTLLRGMKRVAMEYSPGNAIPYVSRVDAGTVEAVRELGVDVVSSGDLIQRFEAIWSDEALATHRAASERLYRVKDRAFELIASRVNQKLSEYDVQQAMVKWFEEEGLMTDSAPCVAAQENAGNPHYQPGPTASRPIHRDELVLLDLWGKLATPGAVFADITWVGFSGSRVPETYARAFAAARDGRNAGVDLVKAAASQRRELRGPTPFRPYQARVEACCRDSEICSADR